jgi:hypothetical protein
MAVMAIVPRRSSISATTVEQFLADELALAEAYEAAVALELKRRNSPAVTPYEVVQAEYRLCGALASGFERELNHTLRRHTLRRASD